MPTDTPATHDPQAPLDAAATAGRRKPEAADVATSSLVKLGHEEWRALCADLESWLDEPRTGGE
jgi:hypothetical protein